MVMPHFQALMQGCTYSQYSWNPVQEDMQYIVTQVYTTLQPRVIQMVENYYGQQIVRQLICLEGTIPVNYRGNTYNIPISVTYIDGFPDRAPVVKVIPTADMLISSSQIVTEDGTVSGLPYVLGWNSYCTTMQLLEACRAEFGNRMPVFSRTSARRSNEQNQGSSFANRSIEPRVKAAFDSLHKELASEVAELKEENNNLLENASNILNHKQMLNEEREVNTLRTKRIMDDCAKLDEWIENHDGADIENLRVSDLVNINNPVSAQLMKIVCSEQALDDLQDKLIQLYNKRVISLNDLMTQLKAANKDLFLTQRLREKAMVAAKSAMPRGF